MRTARLLGGALLVGSLGVIPWSLTGCSKGIKEQTSPQQSKVEPAKAKDEKKAQEPPSADADVKAALAKLSPDDRKLAEAQKFCVVQTDGLLGSMGTPVKLTVKGEPVFICCKSCAKTAERDPDKTLKTLHELKAKAKTEAPISLPPVDAKSPEKADGES